MASSVDISHLDDIALLQLYGQLKTNLVLHGLFSRKAIPDDVKSFVRILSEEISTRGLDQGRHHAAD